MLNPIADAIKGAMRPDTKASSALHWLSLRLSNVDHVALLLLLPADSTY